MAALGDSDITNRYIVPLGPVKMEVLYIASATDADSFVSRLQRPLFAFGAIVSDAVAITESFNVAFSDRTGTINSVDLAADAVAILVFGF
jgi:hypothetical protein